MWVLPRTRWVFIGLVNNSEGKRKDSNKKDRYLVWKHGGERGIRQLHEIVSSFISFQSSCLSILKKSEHITIKIKKENAYTYRNSRANITFSSPNSNPSCSPPRYHILPFYTYTTSYYHLLWQMANLMTPMMWMPL